MVEGQRYRHGDVVALDKAVDGKHHVRIRMSEKHIRDPFLFVAEDERRGPREIPIGDGDGIDIEVGGYNSVAARAGRADKLIGCGPNGKVQPLVGTLRSPAASTLAEFFRRHILPRPVVLYENRCIALGRNDKCRAVTEALCAPQNGVKVPGVVKPLKHGHDAVRACGDNFGNTHLALFRNERRQRFQNNRHLVTGATCFDSR